MEFKSKNKTNIFYKILISFTTLYLLLSCTYETKIKKVVDGDTVITEDGVEIRLIGIDAPEKERFFYQESKKVLKKLVENKKVKVEFDIVKRDKYGRILGYLFIDTIFVNAYLLREGFAFIYTFPPNTKYVDIFRKNLEKAIESKKGMWKYLIIEEEILIGDPEKLEFHRKNCSKVKSMNFTQKIYFHSPLEALKRGFHPHKRCMPLSFSR